MSHSPVLEAKRATPAPSKYRPEPVKQHDPAQNGGVKIRCPHCAWEPRKSDLWACHCGTQWHTFDTGGQCPSCKWNWSQTQCPRCGQWAAHKDWYASGE
jgi:hypothetical protein